jgi:hypothetical protein
MKPDQPMFNGYNLTFGVHFDSDATFKINATDFKYALELKPRAQTDHKRAVDLARKNWDVLELIAKEALDSDRVKRKEIKPWIIHYTIDFLTFSELLDKHAAHFRR